MAEPDCVRSEKKVAIARYSTCKLLDEPFSFLDAVFGFAVAVNSRVFFVQQHTSLN